MYKPFSKHCICFSNKMRKNNSGAFHMCSQLMTEIPEGVPMVPSEFGLVRKRTLCICIRSDKSAAMSPVLERSYMEAYLCCLLCYIWMYVWLYALIPSFECSQGDQGPLYTCMYYEQCKIFQKMTMPWNEGMRGKLVRVRDSIETISFLLDKPYKYIENLVYHCPQQYIYFFIQCV